VGNSQCGDLSRSAQNNIEAVVKLEQQAFDKRSPGERIGDAIAVFSGSMPFFAGHVVGFIVWALVNCGAISGIQPFDPYPFNFLTMVVSLEAVLLSTFVLMRQNWMSRRADRRDRLNLEVDLLAEKEVTKILQLLQKICDRLDIREGRQDQEVEELCQNTAVDRIADELEKKIPD